MLSATRKPAVQFLAWYQAPDSSCCRLVPMELEGHELVPCPTPEQEDLIVYPEVDPKRAGHFFLPCGSTFNLN